MSKQDDKIAELFDVVNWPHLFTKNGKEYQIGEQDYDALFAQPMVCVHCQVEYVAGAGTRPPDPCPARNKKAELKRLRS